MLPRPAVVLIKINFLLRFALEVDDSARRLDRSSPSITCPRCPMMISAPQEPVRAKPRTAAAPDALGKVTCPPSPATITHFRPSVSRPSRPVPCRDLVRTRLSTGHDCG